MIQIELIERITKFIYKYTTFDSNEIVKDIPEVNSLSPLELENIITEDWERQNRRIKYDMAKE